MRNVALFSSYLSLVALCSCSTIAPDPPEERAVELPGPKADGSVLLPNQWSLRPVGKQFLLGDFPVNIAVHPGNHYAAVLHCGHSQHEVIVVDLSTSNLVSHASLDEAFYGITFSKDGKKLFCSGAGKETVHQFDFADGYLSRHETIRLREPKWRAIPAGLAVNSDGTQLFVANVLGHRVSRVDLVRRTNSMEYLLGTNELVFVETDDKKKKKEEEESDEEKEADLAAITKRAEALLDQTQESDPFPYACVLDEKRERLYVSLWAHAAVAVIDLKSGMILEKWPVQDHPNEMVLTRSGRHLFVANANRNTVSVLDTETGRAVETLVAELYPNSPAGSTPNSLALTPDEKILFVANATINALAVFDVSELGKSHSLGFIPVGWYPTSVRVTPDGRKLLVANGKGVMPKANRYGPQPGRHAPGTVTEYIGELFRGTLSVIALPGRERFEQQLKRYTEQTYLCSPPLAGATNTLAGADGNPVPTRPGDPSPIKYCIYVIKENRTYDQVLGDMPQGNGDAGLCLFPEKITPNHHKLAREFVLLDNFYVESEVSADGHEWTMGAYATDFVEKSWPLSYGHNQHKKYSYPAEGNFKIAIPAGGYLWDRAREAGVSYRSYGEFIGNGKKTNDPGTTRVAALKGHFDPWYRGFDTEYPDVKRAARFISELKRFEQEGEMPRLQIVRLPNDHTSGTAEKKPSPTAALGDNDLAFGTFVEAITRSRFWAETAIFVVEDDAQNGPDHVDAHRTIAFVISPYVKRRTVDSTMYSTSSMLRTMELILGLKPMSQFDAAARPMFNTFQARPDLTPYKAEPARVDLHEKNTKRAWGAARSNRMNFAREDAADDLQLNEILWRSLRGAESRMPAPTRAAFVFPHPKEEDD